jgi:hypothetical protein
MSYQTDTLRPASTLLLDAIARGSPTHHFQDRVFSPPRIPPQSNAFFDIEQYFDLRAATAHSTGAPSGDALQLVPQFAYAIVPDPTSAVLSSIGAGLCIALRCKPAHGTISASALLIRSVGLATAVGSAGVCGANECRFRPLASSAKVEGWRSVIVLPWNVSSRKAISGLVLSCAPSVPSNSARWFESNRRFF